MRQASESVFYCTVDGKMHALALLLVNNPLVGVVAFPMRRKDFQSEGLGISLGGKWKVMNLFLREYSQQNSTRLETKEVFQPFIFQQLTPGQ